MAIRRTAAATLLAGALALPLASPALAAQAAPTSVDMWADFQQPAAWMNQSNNLHWYAQSPVITQQMTNRTATTAVTLPAAMDCTELGAGYTTNDAWTNVDFTVTSCTDTQATITFKVTKDMVGSRVFTHGWSATTANPATVEATITIGKDTHTGTVSAAKADEPAPVAPGTALGTWNGATVSLASEASANQIHHGSTIIDAPAGNVVHSSLDGSVVTLWFHDAGSPDSAYDGSMNRWSLDLATNEATTQSIAGHLLAQGGAGFALDVTGQPYFQSDWEYYTWDGTRTQQQTHYFGTIPAILGITDEGYVIWRDSTSRSGPYVSYKSMSGTEYASDSGAHLAWSPTGISLRNPEMLDNGVAYERYTTDGGVARCTLTSAGRTCEDMPTVTVPGEVIGDWAGRTVAVEKTETANTVWVGGNSYPAPAGTVVRSDVTYNDVVVWFRQDSTLTRWNLNPRDGQTVAKVFSGSQLMTGEPGFVVLTDQGWVQYGWDGEVDLSNMDPDMTPTQSSNNAWVWVHATSGQMIFVGPSFQFGSGWDLPTLPSGVKAEAHQVRDLAVQPEKISFTRATPFAVEATGQTGEVIESCVLGAEPPLTCTIVSNPIEGMN